MNKCPVGKVVFYTRILEQLNLRYPFTNFFLEVLKYYHLSLSQLAVISCDVALITGTIGHTSVWKDKFFFVFEKLIPFETVYRKFDEAVNKKEPEASELEHEHELLLKFHASCSKLRAYTEEF
ncbi:hypothetical protein Hanom_Chr10g00899441 [Helianthus anomalus]